MKAIELFAGAGGLGLGVGQAGFKPQRIIEWDRWCCDTLRENRDQRVGPIGEWPEPEQADVRQVDYMAWRDSIDIVTGGPPCQPFSLGGKHRGHRDSRDMWPEAVRALRETRPRAFIFENVKGLTRTAFATYLSHIQLQMTYPMVAPRNGEDWTSHLSRLEQHHSAHGHVTADLEYNVLYQVVNAADHGVPQKRERVVFVGFRRDLGIRWSFPEATHSLDALLWDQVHGDYWERHLVSRGGRCIPGRLRARVAKLSEKPNCKAWLTTRDAIADLPDPELDPKHAGTINGHRFQPGAKSYPGHTGSPLDLPAKTLKAGVHGVPGGENMLARHDGSVRYFTVRESARLQTFPDEFRFHGSWTEAMRQLGNAVPVRLARIVAEDVKRTLSRAN